jgi:hypothetical protein
MRGAGIAERATTSRGVRGKRHGGYPSGNGVPATARIGRTSRVAHRAPESPDGSRGRPATRSQPARETFRERRIHTRDTSYPTVESGARSPDAHSAAPIGLATFKRQLTEPWQQPPVLVRAGARSSVGGTGATRPPDSRIARPKY